MTIKITCCKDCEDRTIEPNCHDTCERYLGEKAEMHRIRDKRIRAKNVDSYIAAHLAHKGRPRG